MLYVEKDLAAIVKAVFDHWDVRKDELDGQYLQASSARITPKEVCMAAEKSISSRLRNCAAPRFVLTTECVDSFRKAM